MKKIWTKPMATVEEFAANEYVAACGDEHRVYKFTCTAPEGTLYYYPESDGAIDGVHTGRGTELGGYEPCRDEHEAPTDDVYYDGFVDYNRNGNNDEGEGVIVWLEMGSFFGRPYIANYHATDSLDMTKWETAKS